MTFLEALEKLKEKNAIYILGPEHHRYCGNYVSRKRYESYKKVMKSIDFISKKDKESNDWKIKE